VTFVGSRWLFLRLLGVIYLIAFVSLAVQITGLAGEHGILPAGEFLARARNAYGDRAYLQWPTLVWVSQRDAFLSFLAWGGAVVSLLLIAGVAPLVSAALLWFVYLSLSIAGQLFLEFQWDALLLETGVLAILYAPFAWRSRIATDPEPPASVRWVLWFLAFKLTFLSGITKILSGDRTWANWTALTYHYETQPIPAWTSWYMHQLPERLHVWSVAGMFVIELVMPWLIFAPPRFARVRLVAALSMISLQLGIAATGNYGFFNLLTVVLCLALLDDRTLTAWLPRRRAAGDVATPTSGPRGRRVLWHLLASGTAIGIAGLSVMTVFREIDTTRGRTGLEWTWSDSALRQIAPLRSVSGYGLFRVMTTERPEIVIEVSGDGTTWNEYEFKWKAGDVYRRPSFVEPHMPRLDWQMWFAALDPRGAESWLAPFVQRLLDGEPVVTRLLGPSPLAGPVRCVKLAYYQYHFTTRAERAANGAWWKRERVGDLTNAICR
jgi:hypothetical protein